MEHVSDYERQDSESFQQCLSQEVDLRVDQIEHQNPSLLAIA